MSGPLIPIWLALPWLLCATPPAEPATPEPATDEPLRAQVNRLVGHRVSLVERAGVLVDYTIDDIAGEGPPRVGQIEARADALWLVESGERSVRLGGPLARPRIAGPGYKVWVVGEMRANDTVLWVRRIGVLAPPAPRIRTGNRPRP